MNKKVVIFFAVASLVILIAGLIVKLTTTNSQLSTTSLQQLSQTPKNIVINNTSISVEVSDNDQTRTLGLGKRDSLDPSSGMFFSWGSKVTPAFWMKDMRFPIDIIWINASKIVKIDASVPVPELNTPDGQLPIYFPNQPIDWVLEVNSGFANSHNIKVGDQVVKNF